MTTLAILAALAKLWRRFRPTPAPTVDLDVLYVLRHERLRQVVNCNGVWWVLLATSGDPCLTLWGDFDRVMAGAAQMLRLGHVDLMALSLRTKVKASA